MGGGPVYPVLFDPNAQHWTAAIGFVPSQPYPGGYSKRGWYYQKTLWFSLPSYSGPLLIRGGRIDRPGGMLFVQGKRGQSSLKLTVTQDGKSWWATSSATLVPHVPGCYAYQLDGTSFSYVLVFRAVRTPAAYILHIGQRTQVLPDARPGDQVFCRGRNDLLHTKITRATGRVVWDKKLILAIEHTRTGRVTGLCRPRT